MRVYNTKQQALNAKKIAELFLFTSNNFGGLISNDRDPIVLDTENHCWTWSPSLNSPINFMGGGVNIEYDVEFTKSFVFTESSEFCSVWGLDVTIPDANASISTNEYNRDNAQIVETACTEVTIEPLYIIINYPSGNPANKEYYEYDDGEYVLSQDTEVVDGKTYYYRLEKEAFKIKGLGQDKPFNLIQPIPDVDYYGNTIWITDNRFFIPFCFRDKEGNLTSMLFNRDKTGYESFLSARTYYHLLSELGDTFVFRVGGPTKGDVGDLNITDNYITNKVDSSAGVKIENPIFTDVVDSATASDMDNILLINSESGRVYKTNSNYLIPIKHGGTSANKIDSARTNLGFTYGTADPTIVPKRINYSTNTEEDDIGAVYFKLL